MKINRYSLFPKTLLCGIAFVFAAISTYAQMPALLDCGGPAFIPVGQKCGATGAYIRSVVTTGGIVNFNNSNTNCGNATRSYSDYTTEAFYVKQDAGKTFDVNITCQPTGTFVSSMFKVYIDWDKDGNFNGTDEYIAPPAFTGIHPHATQNSGTQVTIKVPVPGHAKEGITRMRVVMSSFGFVYDLNCNQCGASGGGAAVEIEDYRIEVVNPCLPPNVISIANIDFKSADVSWTPKPNAEFYEYLITPIDTIPDDTIIGFSFTTSAAIDVDTFKCNTKYYVLVRLICDTTNKIGALYWDKSAWHRDSFTTQPCCYDPVLTVDRITSTTARVSWPTVPTAVGYEYSVSTSTTPPQKGTYTTANNVILQGLSSRTTFFVHVRTRCTPTPLSGWSKYGFKTLGPLSIAATTETSLFVMDVYPNPMQDQLNVQFNGKIGTNAKLTIIDLTGKVVHSSAVYTDKVTIDAENLTSGIYIVKYTDDVHNQVIRVTKK